MKSCWMPTVGSPLASVCQVPPPSTEAYMLMSVPTTRTGEGNEGNVTTEVVGMSGRLWVMFVHDVPPFVVFQTWPTPKLPKVAYAVLKSAGSTAIAVTGAAGRPAERSVHSEVNADPLLPAVVRQMCPWPV